MAPCASRISSSSERSGTPRSASRTPCESMRRAASPSRFLCAATRSQSRAASGCRVRTSAILFSLTVRPPGAGTRSLTLGQRLAVSGADDVRPVPGIVEVRGVRRLVAADAEARGDLAPDEPARGVLDVLAAGAMAVLALHVPAAHAPAVQTGAAPVGAVDPAYPARLLPTGHVALDAVEAELFVDVDQGVVSVRVLGLDPEVGSLLVALRARRRPEERRLSSRRGRTRLGLALRLGEVQLGHPLVVRIDELLRIRVRTDVVAQRDEARLRPGGSRRGPGGRSGQDGPLALFQLADLRLQLLPALRRGGDLQAEALDASVEALHFFLAIRGRGRERQRPGPEVHVEAEQALPMPLHREQRRQ